MSETTDPTTPNVNDVPPEPSPPVSEPIPTPAVTQTIAPSPAPLEEKKPLTSVKRVGVACDKNARYRRTMEDAHVVIDQIGGVESQGYFAVYDGHGGRACVEFVAERLHKNLEEELKTNENIEEAIKNSYLKTDKEVGEAKIQFSGTTAASILVRVENGVRKLYSANVGDARCILVRNKIAERLTIDHKATEESEVKRIQEVGGFVVMGRVNGILAVTRSLGDQTMKDYVSGEPYTKVIELLPTDTHCIIACDGVWDVLTDQEAVDVILKYDEIAKCAKALLIESLKRGSTDNISVMVIEL